MRPRVFPAEDFTGSMPGVLCDAGFNEAAGYSPRKTIVSGERTARSTALQ